MSGRTAEAMSGKLFIDGSWGAGAGGTLLVLDPSTEQPVGEMAEAGVSDAVDAARAAKAAQPAWARTAASTRSSVFRRIARLIAERGDHLVDLQMREGGFTRTTASRFVSEGKHWFDFAAEATLRDRSIATPPYARTGPDGRESLMNGVIQGRPIGVVTAIVPFNGPFFGACLKSAMAMAAGNTVVVKPAFQNPLAVYELFRIFAEAGLPAGVANLVTSSDPEVGAELTRSEDVDMVTFTGSTAVGRQVYRAGAATMKRLVLELGGKGACLVLDDADVDKAAQGIASVWRVNTGQICSAPTRAIVHRSVHDHLVDRLTQLAAGVTTGSPFVPGTIAGPVISAAQRDRVEGFVTSARDEGAEVVTGGARPAGLDRGYFVAPTLLDGCHNQMRAVREEIFGPVVSVLTVDGDDEAIAVANDSDYGLAAYIFSSDTVRAFRIGSELDNGLVQINTVGLKPDMPRGGRKMSGLGREGGDLGLEHFTETTSMVWE